MENELIEKILRENLENRLSDYDFEYLIKDELSAIINKNLKEQIEEKIKNILNDEITKLVNEILQKELIIDDGWKKQKYESFEDFFKLKLKANLEDSYKIKNIVSDLVNERIRQIEKEKGEQIKEEIIKKFSN